MQHSKQTNPVKIQMNKNIQNNLALKTEGKNWQDVGLK